MLSWLHTNLIKRDSFERDLERSNLEQDLGGCLRFEEILYMTAACKASGITLDQEALRKILHQCWRDNSDAALKKSPYYAPYRRWRALERNSLLGNNLSPEVNQRYALYREKCRESFQNGSGVAESNDVQVEGLLGGLDTNGICAIEGANIGELAKLGQRALDRSLEENRFPHFIDYGRIWGYPTEEEGVAMARDLYSVLSEPLVEQCLHGFFGSHFRLRYVTIECHEAWGKEYDLKQAAAGFWHLDELPTHVLKIFIYLNDLAEENGAMRCFNKELSGELMEKGFYSGSNVSRTESQSLITEEVMKEMIVLEKGSGTVALFDPRSVVHKMEKPRKGARKTLKMTLVPSLTPISLKNVYQAFMAQSLDKNSEFFDNADYSLDPASNPLDCLPIPSSLQV